MHTVTYFGIPGRGEIVRLMLQIGGLPFDDVIISGKQWRDLKPKTRWGVLPTLTLPDGTVAGQSRALLRYLGKVVKVDGTALYPDEPPMALLVDEVCDYIEDIWGNLITILHQNKEDKAEYAADLINGEILLMLNRLESAVAGPWVTGHRVTVGDIYIYAAISWWSSGFFSNEINLQTLLGSTRPKLTSICHGVRAMPAVKAYYKDKNGPRDKLWAQFRIATTSPKSKL